MAGYGGFYGGGGGLRDAAAPQEPVNDAGYAAGGGWGAQHNLSVAEVQQDAEQQRSGAVHGTGTLTHFQPAAHVDASGNVVRWAGEGPSPTGAGVGHGPGAGGGELAAAASLGEPTSYGGGRGAPTPIEVFNAAGRSYVNPEGGAGYKTPLEAGQVWNQKNAEPGSEAATFRPVGTTMQELKNKGEVDKTKATGLATLAEAQGPGIAAAGRTAVEKANNDTYRNAVGPLAHGKELDPVTGQPVQSADPAFQEIVNKYHALSFSNPQAAVAGLQKDYGALQDDRLYNQHAATILDSDPRFSKLSPATRNLYLSGNPQMKADLMPVVKQYVATQKQQSQVEQPYANPMPFAQ